MPEPVLKITTRSPEAILPTVWSDFKAAKQAAASGQTKIPSLAPTSRATPIISSSCGFGSRSRLRGQLKGWLQKRNINRPLGLCYFGMADPRYYAIAHDNLPGGYPFEAERSFDILHSGSLFAISATNLQGVLYTAQRRKKWDRILQESKLVDTVGYSIFIYEFQPSLTNELR